MASRLFFRKSVHAPLQESWIKLLKCLEHDNDYDLMVENNNLRRRLILLWATMHCGDKDWPEYKETLVTMDGPDLALETTIPQIRDQQGIIRSEAPLNNSSLNTTLAEDDPFARERWEPKAVRYTRELAAGRLSTEEFPFQTTNDGEAKTSEDRVRIATSVRKKTAAQLGEDTRPTGLEAESDDEEETEGSDQCPRLIVFLLGGAAHSEIQGLQRLAEEMRGVQDIIVGTTHLSTPTGFIKGLEAPCWKL